jgi:hypothetical protein
MGTFAKVNAILASNVGDQEIWVCTDVTGAATTVAVSMTGGGFYYALALEVSGGSVCGNELGPFDSALSSRHGPDK